MKQKYIFIALIFLQVWACKKENPQNKVDIRARIINARTDEVLVAKNFLFIHADTLSIENENEIKGKVQTDSEGLYFIYIYPEFQTVYLKPGDSLAFHINIDEFDESLSFSGNLGFENNLLMELYLINEKESEYFYKAHFQFQPDEFLSKIDSFSLYSQNLLHNYQKELKNTTSKYRKIIDLWEKSLQYNLKEAYLIRHPDADLPENYTAYHQILHSKLPDANIIYMYAFVENYIRRKLSGEISSPEEWYRKTAEIINKNISDNDFKDNLLAKYCFRYIKEKKIKQLDSITRLFFKHIQNPSYTNFCKQHIEKNKRLQAGNKFPSVELRSPQNQKKLSDSIFKNQKILLSFWDLKRRKNFISNLEKLKKIKEEFPKLEIIVLNTDSRLFDEWLLELPVDSKIKFYQISRTSDKEKISPYHPAQIFLIENNSIKKSMLNMYATGFKKELQKFINGKTNK